jgi:hypothetical protein
MDIHASHEPVHSWREVFRQLLIITAGVFDRPRLRWSRQLVRPPVARARVVLTLAVLTVEEQIGQQLLKRYQLALQQP